MANLTLGRLVSIYAHGAVSAVVLTLIREALGGSTPEIIAGLVGL